MDLGVPPEYAMQMVRVSRVKPAKAEPTIEASSNNNDTATDMEQDNAVSSATNVVDLEVEKVKQEPVENKDAKVEPEVKVEEDEDVEYVKKKTKEKMFFQLFLSIDVYSWLSSS